MTVAIDIIMFIHDYSLLQRTGEDGAELTKEEIQSVVDKANSHTAENCACEFLSVIVQASSRVFY